MSQISKFISLVVYIHNNEDLIVKFIQTVMKTCEAFKQTELIFVDDFSTDHSVETIKEYYRNNPSDCVVSIIRLGRYHGMETAMNAGRDMAIGDYVYEFDDMYIDYEPSIILDAFNKCLEGNDIVTVSTKVSMRLTSHIYYKIFNNAMASNSPIGQETFRLLSRRGVNRIISMGVDIPYRKVIYHNSGLSIAALYYKSTKGVRPARNIGQVERLDLAIDTFIYFTSIIERVSLIVAGFFALLSIGAIIYAIVTRIQGTHIGLGYASTMIFMSIGFTGVYGLLTFIVRYLRVLVNLDFKKQKYLITDIDKISSK